MSKPDNLARQFGLQTIEKYVRDPHGYSRKDLRSYGGITGWYERAISTIMRTSGLSLHEIQETVASFSGRNKRSVTRAVRNLARESDTLRPKRSNSRRSS